MRAILEQASRLFEDWNDNQVTYCHWKSNEHLWEGLAGETDLDILVSKADKQTAEVSLRKFGYIKTVSQYGSRYDNVDDWVACDYATGKMLHIHLHYQLITGHKGLKEYDLPFGEDALACRQLHDEFPVYVVDPSLEIIILFSRIALKATHKKIHRARKGKYQMSCEDIREINYLLERLNAGSLKEYCQKYFKEDAEILSSLMLSEEKTAVWFCKLYTIVQKHLSKTNRIAQPLCLLLRNYYLLLLYARIFLKKKTRFNPITRKTFETGMIIAFIGQDGAGKSTVTDEVLKWLTWKMDATKFYLGSGEHYFSWQKAVRKKLGKKNPICRLLHNLLTVSDLKKIANITRKKIFQAQTYAHKGAVAIFDRYPQLEFEGINDGAKIRHNSRNKKTNFLSNAYISLFARAEEKNLRKAVSVQPDLVFKMLLPPEESIRRKPEESLENVQRKHEIIKALSFQQSRVVIIDATQDYEEELKVIHKEIWRFLLERNGEQKG